MDCTTDSLDDAQISETAGLGSLVQSGSLELDQPTSARSDESTLLLPSWGETSGLEFHTNADDQSPEAQAEQEQKQALQAQQRKL